MQKYDYVFKYLLLGDYFSGKTAIVNRFIFNNFYPSAPGTIGVDFHSKDIKIKDTKIRLSLWDTSGQDRFKIITESYLTRTTCVLLVFDLTDLNSFDKVKYWLDIVKTKSNKHIVYLLVGTKSDSDYTKPINNEITQFINENNLIFIKTSSKDNININKIFELSAEIILEKIHNNMIDNQLQELGIKIINEKKNREDYCILN